MKRIVSVFIILLVTSGCRSSWTTETLRERPKIDLKLDTDAKAIEKSTTAIYKLTDKPEIQAETVALKSVATGLWGKFQENMKQVDYVKKIEDQLIKYENDERQQVINIFIILLSIGLLSLIAGLAVIVFGSQAGMSSLGIQLIALGSGITGVAVVLLYFPWIAITFGIAILGAGMLYLAYKWTRTQQKSKRVEGINERVMVEIIRSFEYLKHHNWNDDTKELVNTFQSPETQEKIDEIKQLDTYKTIKIKGSRRDEH